MPGSALQHWWGLQRARLQTLCVCADRGRTCFCDGRWLAACEGPMFSASSSASSASRAAAERCALADLQAQSREMRTSCWQDIVVDTQQCLACFCMRTGTKHSLGFLLDGFGFGHADQAKVSHQAADRQLRFDPLSAATGCCAADLRHWSVTPQCGPLPTLLWNLAAEQRRSHGRPEACK